MNALQEQWQQLSAKLNSLAVRERALIICSVLLGIYLVWDFAFYQPLSKSQSNLAMRLDVAEKALVKLTAEEQVFTLSLKNDPGAAKKREIVRLEQELKSVDQTLQKLSVGLIAAEKLPDVLYDVLKNSSDLTFYGMQTHPVELLSFDDEVAALDAEDEKQHDDYSEAEQEERMLGVFKHSVTVSFEGDYFSVVRYLRSLETSGWKLYWNILDYEVARFPKASITLEVFTLSTEEGLLSAES